MRHRHPHRLDLAIALTVVVAAVSPVTAQAYGYGYGGHEEEGFFVFLDASLSRPGDTDLVVAESTSGGGVIATSRIAPEWGAAVAGRVGFGYRWSAGGKLSVTAWRHDDDETLAVDGPDGGFLDFAIGPSVYDEDGLLLSFGDPGRAAFDATVKASTIDVEFGQQQELSDVLTMEWSVGVRAATYEDRVRGTYDLCAGAGCGAGNPFLPGEIAYAADRSTESNMVGVRAGVLGRYRVSERVAIRSALALSLLNGKIESTSGLTPTGTLNAGVDPTTRFSADEDDRSGRILDLDVGVEFDVVRDLLRLSLGYEHSVWDGVPRDLARNPPAQYTVNAPRDAVTFAGVRLGVWVRF